MTSDRAARRWAEVWAQAWPAADVEAIVALYAPNAVFYSHPFRARQSPREYVETVFADQVEAECRFGEPLVSDERAAVDWWGVITSKEGAVEAVAGTSLLRFDADGLVVAQSATFSAKSITARSTSSRAAASRSTMRSRTISGVKGSSLRILPCASEH